MEDSQSSGLVPYGQPIRRRFPFRGNCSDIEMLCEPLESKEIQKLNGRLKIFIEEKAYNRIETHAIQFPKVEVGGALLGQYCIDEEFGLPFLMIYDVFPAFPDINEEFASPILMRFTHTFIKMLDAHVDELNKEDLKLIRLGMYHSHPGYTCFMSKTDIETFRTIFREPWHISLIIDPLNKDVGVFHWVEADNGQFQISEKTGFYRFKRRVQRTNELNSTEQREEG